MTITTSYENFYPRPPRGGRLYLSSRHLSMMSFLSTPSARRATSALSRFLVACAFLSTPSARRATSALSRFLVACAFLSTPSARRATVHAEGCSRLFQISIHALREEGDWSAGRSRHRLWNFYPRPPRGGRLRSGTIIFRPDKISIHALREEGDAPIMQGLNLIQGISIHALREEGDLLFCSAP